MARRRSLSRACAALVAGASLALPAGAADPPAVKLVIKPVLCVLDKDASSCSITFDIRWRSNQTADYCLGDSVNATPLRCWERAASGDLRHERSFSEDFLFWLADAAGDTRLTEVKIEVLRVGSSDRRRERRTRHVWDVL